MIPEHHWLRKEIKDGQEIFGILSSKISGFSEQLEVWEMSLFSLNPDGGRLEDRRVSRNLLQEYGLKVMEEFGLDQNVFRLDEKERGLNSEGARVVENGAKQYLVYPSASIETIEFLREATFIKPVGSMSDSLDNMAVNNVKWSVRYTTDKNYLSDILP